MRLLRKNNLRVAGLDEAGRGPLAGPVVAAAVILPDGFYSDEIKDSKQLSAKKREYLYEEIIKEALDYSIVAVGQHRIDQINILNASLLAMAHCAKRVNAEFLVVDGNRPIPTTIPQITVVGGDCKYLQVAAASILAKVWRDSLMDLLEDKYGGYGLAKHKGYPTAEHKQALRAFGPSPVHRRSFAGVKELLEVGLG
ncbi:MAG TPA: ribonuclease HII [Oligoflexia bacterium]|nr:ribonuclease HII [Oligoflexia bacterium]HMP26602.1 ribonuclease HII [Oligoflexia bacterium]